MGTDSTAVLGRGAMLGRYRLQQRLGGGGGGQVWLAARTDSFDGLDVARNYAIKVRPVLGGEERAYDFLREWVLSGSIHHPNVVEVREVGRSGDLLWYVVMDYIEGLTFQAIARRARELGGALPLSLVLEMGMGACAGLRAIHEARREDGRPLRMIHRDVKPSNLMVDEHGVVKVVDLGIARADGAPGQTRTGWVKGTPAYMAPEQEEARELGPSADLYALGAVLFEQRTGERLFDGEDFYAMLRQKRGEHGADRLAAHAAALGPLGPVLQRCLAVDPTERPQSASELEDALRSLYRACPPGPGLREFMGALLRGELPPGPLDAEWERLFDALDQPWFPPGYVDDSALPAADAVEAAKGEAPRSPPEPRPAPVAASPPPAVQAAARAPTPAPRPPHPPAAPIVDLKDTASLPHPVPADLPETADAPAPAPPPTPPQRAAAAAPEPATPAAPKPAPPAKPPPSAKPAARRQASPSRPPADPNAPPTIFEPVPVTPRPLPPAPDDGSGRIWFLVGAALTLSVLALATAGTFKIMDDEAARVAAETAEAAERARAENPAPPSSTEPPRCADGDGDGATTCSEAPDCADGDADIAPGLPELCDGKDNDCDGVIPPAELDSDGDGFIGCEAWEGPADAPAPQTGDCDDGRADVHPGAEELCDGRDTDCDGTLPTAERDADHDGVTVCGGDCDDGDASTHPGATDDPGGADRDCDGRDRCFRDADGDGYGDDALQVDGPAGCKGDGLAARGGDCDDASRTTHPDAAETGPDNKDNDCDGEVDEGYNALFTSLALSGDPSVRRSRKSVTIEATIRDPRGSCDELRALWRHEDQRFMASRYAALQPQGSGHFETTFTAERPEPVYYFLRCFHKSGAWSDVSPMSPQSDKKSP